MAGEAGDAWDVATAFDDVGRALTGAHEDLGRLDAAIDRLDPARTARELKAALRAHPPGVAPDDDPLVVARRERYETLHRLQDRRDDLAARIEVTIAEVEAVAARLVGASFDATPGGELRAGVDGLRVRAAALDAAHAELRLL